MFLEGEAARPCWLHTECVLTHNSFHFQFGTSLTLLSLVFTLIIKESRKFIFLTARSHKEKKFVVYFVFHTQSTCWSVGQCAARRSLNSWPGLQLPHIQIWLSYMECVCLWMPSGSPVGTGQSALSETIFWRVLWVRQSPQEYQDPGFSTWPSLTSGKCCP